MSFASRWRYEADDRSYEPVALVDGTLFARDEGSIVALDAATGAERWVASVDVENRAPVAVGPDRIYLPRGWFPRDPDADSPDLVGYPGVDGAVENLTIQGDASYYNGRHDVYRVPFGGDEPEWTTEIVEAEGFQGDIAPGALFGAGDVLVATKGGRSWAFDRATGEQVWRQTRAFEDGLDVVAARPDRIYGVEYADDNALALDAGSGEREWDFEFDFQPAVAANDDTLVLGARTTNERTRRVLVLDASGERRWATPLEVDDAIFLPPVVADGVVYTHTVGSLTAFDGTDGTELWSVGGLRQVSTVVVGERSLFVGVDGDVYGLGPGG